MRSHRCSMGLRRGVSTSLGRMSNSIRRLRVRRVPCGLALSYRNTVLGAPCNQGRTTGSTTCVTERSAIKRPTMCIRGVLGSNIMPPQTMMPG
ncbi:hypothetical protein TNCV_5051111 [Trichonephila clavipes]|nr:hypothetical protein TNCV_5051111 [Trichonephila clavipes]